MALVKLKGSAPKAHPNDEAPRDGRGRPFIIQEHGGKPITLTRTTTYVDAIEDKTGLTAWKQRETMIGLAEKEFAAQGDRDPSTVNRVVSLHRDLLDYTADRNEDEARKVKRALNAMAEECMDAAGANRKREQGTHLHKLSEFVDQGIPLPDDISDVDLLDMMAYMEATIPLEVIAIEQFVVHQGLRAGGTFDRLVHYTGPGPDGAPVDGYFIADLKTGSVELGYTKIAAQLAIYANSQRYDFKKFRPDTSDKKLFDQWKKTIFTAEEGRSLYSPILEGEDVSKSWGIIIHLPEGSGECELLWVDLEHGWRAALECQRIRELRGVGFKKVMRPVEWSTAEDDLTS